MLNKHVDKLYLEALKIKDVVKNCFITSFDDNIFIDDLGYEYYNQKKLFNNTSRKPIKAMQINTYKDVEMCLQESVGIKNELRDSIFGFKISSEGKNTIHSIIIQRKKKEEFVIDDMYKFYYNTIMNIIAGEFSTHPERYSNNINNIDERILWLATRLSSRIVLLDSRFYDDPLKSVVKPFEHIVNYDKMPDFVISYEITNLFSIILAILYNKSIKSGFIKFGSEHVYSFIQDSINDSYCEFIYFEDEFNIKQKL